MLSLTNTLLRVPICRCQTAITMCRMMHCLHALQGANTPFIMKSRGLSRAVPMSEMLERNPQIKHLMESGELVPDVSPPPPTLPLHISIAVFCDHLCLTMLRSISMLVAEFSHCSLLQLHGCSHLPTDNKRRSTVHCVIQLYVLWLYGSIFKQLGSELSVSADYGR